MELAINQSTNERQHFPSLAHSTPYSPLPTTTSYSPPSPPTLSYPTYETPLLFSNEYDGPGAAEPIDNEVESYSDIESYGSPLEPVQV